MTFVTSEVRVGTGIAGLDEVLCGGLPGNRVYLVQGDPGTGKTTLALHYLREGVRVGETVLSVTLSETREEMEAVARSHGWSLDGITTFEMGGDEAVDTNEDENTLYVPAEVELGERMQALLAEVDRVKPTRIVIDSCSELRLLAQTPSRFRRQVVALKKKLIQRRCTILLLDIPALPGGDPLLQSLVHGVIEIEQRSPLYGAERRRMRVLKCREVRYSGGWHDMAIKTGGLIVYPRLVASDHHEPFERQNVSCGVAGLDALLCEGIDRGTGTLIMGPAGSGKSALATQYAVASAARRERAAIFAFEEGLGTFYARSAALGMDAKHHVEAGYLTIRQVDPAELSQGEFAHVVRHAVEHDGVRMIVIDSLNGYLHAMAQEDMLVVQLHELLSYLRERGVIVFLLMAQHGFVGGHMLSPVDVSYLADNVILTRFFEAEGRVRKALSIVKKRGGRHEDTIREFSLGPKGFVVSEPLREFRGILTGVPVSRESHAPASLRDTMSRSVG